MTCSVNNDSRDDVLIERLLNSSDANAHTITGNQKFASLTLSAHIWTALKMIARKAPWKFPSVVNLAF